MNNLNSVNILPGVNVLTVLPHLNYKSWYALAEFVDNSIQSSITRHNELVNLSGQGKYTVEVNINFDKYNNLITINDNAAGISSTDYVRAFRPAEIPPDASGLSEFGMGMKSAACWFAPKWSVRTSALGESIERTVFFDIEKIVHDRLEELNIVNTPVSSTQHYTEIRLEEIREFPKGRTRSKIKEHLESIYRVFIRNGRLKLKIDEEILKYSDPEILIAPQFNQPNGQPLKWKKEINFDLGENKSVTGFVAIREQGNTRLAGLALFRRNRLVLGSVDETYRPYEIFGNSNSFPYQRIFGEIHLKGFQVSHTKDGVKWEEKEDEFLGKLRKLITSNDFPLLQQGREYRTRKDIRNNRSEASVAGRNISTNFNEAIFPELSEPELNSLETEKYIKPIEPEEVENYEFNYNFQGEPWIVEVQLSYDVEERNWLSMVNQPAINDPEPRKVTIRIAMQHPFMVQYSNLDSQGLEPLLNIAATIALSEVMVTEVPPYNPGSIRYYINQILKNQPRNVHD